MLLSILNTSIFKKRVENPQPQPVIVSSWRREHVTVDVVMLRGSVLRCYVMLLPVHVRYRRKGLPSWEFSTKTFITFSWVFSAKSCWWELIWMHAYLVEFPCSLLLRRYRYPKYPHSPDNKVNCSSSVSDNRSLQHVPQQPLGVRLHLTRQNCRFVG